MNQRSDNPEMTNENPLNIAGAALTVFDDDKLIHKSNLVFNNVFNGQSNRGIIICSRASACFTGQVIFPTGGYYSPKRKKYNNFCAGLNGDHSHLMMMI